MSDFKTLLKFTRRPHLQRLTGLRPVSTHKHYSSDVPGNTGPPNDSQSLRKGETQTRTGWLFVDSVFPVRLGVWDIRHYVRYLREETLEADVRALLSTVKTHDFHVLSTEPHVKDGGVFVKFSYCADDSTHALEAIMQDLKAKRDERGGMPSWLGLSRGKVWLVKGKPWHEDMRRFASPILKVAFEGPDVHEESLYELLRPFGRIEDITQPTPVPAGVLRSSIVTFQRLRSAASAHNAIHGITIPPSPSASTLTSLRTSYQKPIQAHAVRDYIANHPKIFLPVLFFLLGTLTYTIFDPIRTLMVEGKMEGWFDIKEFKLYQWLQTNALNKFSLTSTSNEEDSASPRIEEVWKERRDAEGALERYLTDMPSTVAFVHGPQGSGKSLMISAALKENGRKALMIDIAELSKASSDTALVTGLALQTGYWPVFSIFNSMSNLIDLASVGIIGQKAGLSSSLDEQLKQILEVVGTGLTRVNAAHRSQRSRAVQLAHLAELQKEEGAVVEARIREGRWHDGRLDCVAGNGVMSELGVGDEWFGDADTDASDCGENDEKPANKEAEAEELRRRQRSAEDVHAVEAMPIVVIKGFESKGGGPSREILLNVLAQWSAKVARNQIAHVIVVSDNRENSKALAKALPSQPLNLITLSDADKHSALSFVQQKLHDAGVQVTPGQRSYVERLGGRASDLESLVHKIRGGLTVEEAVDDIITRGVSEIRKNAFGDEIEDAKNLPWTREQAWFLMKKLSKRPEISYHEVLMDFPFKGDEATLRNLEHAELIAIGTYNGRPSTIRPGKPVYRYVFERLVGDIGFQAVQDISFNEKVIAAAEGTVKTCEQELLALKDVDAGTSRWYGSRSAVSSRSDYLLKKMRIAEDKIEALDKQNAGLKKIFSKAG